MENNILNDSPRASLDHHFEKAKATEAEKLAAMQQEQAYSKQRFANAGIAAGNLARGPEQSDPSFALEAAAAVTRTLENFYPGNFLSRLLTRGEKLAALRAAIATYEHLGW